MLFSNLSEEPGVCMYIGIADFCITVGMQALRPEKQALA